MGTQPKASCFHRSFDLCFQAEKTVSCDDWLDFPASPHLCPSPYRSQSPKSNRIWRLRHE
jgi:hypothetical protein